MPRLFSQAVRSHAHRVSSKLRGSPIKTGKIVILESFSMSSKRTYTLSLLSEHRMAAGASRLFQHSSTQTDGITFNTWSGLYRHPSNAHTILYSTSAAGNNHGCVNCHNCSNCNFCKDCDDCANCNGCTGCKDCSNCNDCVDCENCSNCNDCSGLKNASNESGVHQ